jgi:hypothetical protein
MQKFDWYLRNPLWTIRRALYKIYERRHPDEPWITPGAVHFCDQNLSGGQIGLEWGSGRSTKWYAERLERLVSVEFDPYWHNTVTRSIEGLSNVECRFVAVEHPFLDGTGPYYDPVPRYVAVADEFPDESLGFVVVDGYYRQACVLRALAKLKPGALLLIDNTDWMPLQQFKVPSNWQIVHQSHNVMGETTIWRKPYN